ncbi:MAG: response regulator [Clostridia bacterium]|nr:response regulator [Clostridia bacterium]
MEKKAGTEASEDSKGTVVIVDDSALIRKMLRGLLEADGYTVVGEAVNGEEGVAEYKKNKPDIITLDITMPVMDGLEALKQIMEYDKEAKVIMITAAGQQQKVITALKLGAAKFMMKPFNKDEVIGAFEELRG